jgi:hypothetical protein
MPPGRETLIDVNCGVSHEEETCPPNDIVSGLCAAADEVLRELRDIRELRHERPVNSLLPSTLHDICAEGC